ncbi:MAG TPA: hypothetical protein VGQ76_00345 [Thermoanaerobaculia bacterium]|jgi:hypothetical protein|nr:hypothetical protein [Thermoanaerobaculia bacterium]
MIRFTVEERHLTDGDGRPVTAPDAVAFHTFEAETIDDAVRLYMSDDQAELIGNVLKFPGFQAVATVRKASGVYTLQFTPASHGFQL